MSCPKLCLNHKTLLTSLPSIWKLVLELNSTTCLGVYAKFDLLTAINNSTHQHSFVENVQNGSHYRKTSWIKWRLQSLSQPCHTDLSRAALPGVRTAQPSFYCCFNYISHNPPWTGPPRTQVHQHPSPFSLTLQGFSSKAHKLAVVG